MVNRIRAGSLVILAATSLALTACVLTPMPGGLYVGPAIAVAPPAPRVEYYGAAPYPGYFWVGGYWNWTGYRYNWVGGHWQVPRRGYAWAPRRWVHDRDGWRMRGGRWMRR